MFKYLAIWKPNKTYLYNYSVLVPSVEHNNCHIQTKVIYLGFAVINPGKRQIQLTSMSQSYIFRLFSHQTWWCSIARYDYPKNINPSNLANIRWTYCKVASFKDTYIPWTCRGKKSWIHCTQHICLAGWHPHPLYSFVFLICHARCPKLH